jgi:hypothetical protein
MRLGEPLPRYVQLRGLIDSIEVISKAASQMRLIARCAALIAQRGP